ncbi:MAG TPA: NUDIX domain-containing protein [Paludibacter sp.]|nr:NUDIX domain-containing protein [Paludibacter sp.]
MRFAELFSFCPVCGASGFSINNEKSKRCIDCGFVMYVNPSAAVAAFIINKNDELLVCVRGKNPEKGTLDLPGGFVDENETAENAMIREIYEELNGEVTEINYLFSLPNTYLYSGWTIPTLDLFFAVKLKDFTVLKPADDVSNFQFIAVKDLDSELFGLKSIKKAISILRNKADIE